MADHAQAQHDDHESHGSTRLYLMVFLALCVLTGASFFTYSEYWPFHDTPKIGWAFMMAVSCTKALLVILFFMHLLWEAKWKYVLTIPAIFMALFLLLMLVPDIGWRLDTTSREALLYMATPGENFDADPGTSPTDPALTEEEAEEETAVETPAAEEPAAEEPAAAAPEASQPASEPAPAEMKPAETQPAAPASEPEPMESEPAPSEPESADSPPGPPEPKEEEASEPEPAESAASDPGPPEPQETEPSDPGPPEPADAESEDAEAEASEPKPATEAPEPPTEE